MIFIPLRVSFFEEEASVFWDFVDFGVDFIFILDIIFNFFTPYYEGYYLIVNKKKIVWNYLTGLFVVDLISVFPLRLIYLSSDATYKLLS